MHTTSYIRDNVAEMGELCHALESLTERIDIMERRVTGQERVQDEQAKALTTLANGQGAAYCQIEQLAENQGRLTKSQKSLSQEQAAGFDKLTNLMESLQVMIQKNTETMETKIQAGIKNMEIYK